MHCMQIGNTNCLQLQKYGQNFKTESRLHVKWLGFLRHFQDPSILSSHEGSLVKFNLQLHLEKRRKGNAFMDKHNLSGEGYEQTLLMFQNWNNFKDE